MKNNQQKHCFINFSKYKIYVTFNIAFYGPKRQITLCIYITYQYKPQTNLLQLLHLKKMLIKNCD